MSFKAWLKAPGSRTSYINSPNRLLSQGRTALLHLAVLAAAAAAAAGRELEEVPSKHRVPTETLATLLLAASLFSKKNKNLQNLQNTKRKERKQISFTFRWSLSTGLLQQVEH